MKNKKYLVDFKFVFCKNSKLKKDERIRSEQCGNKQIFAEDL